MVTPLLVAMLHNGEQCYNESATVTIWGVFEPEILQGALGSLSQLRSGRYYVVQETGLCESLVGCRSIADLETSLPHSENYQTLGFLTWGMVKYLLLFIRALLWPEFKFLLWHSFPLFLSYSQLTLFDYTRLPPITKGCLLTLVQLPTVSTGI